jgi:hypothetical protein
MCDYKYGESSRENAECKLSFSSIPILKSGKRGEPGFPLSFERRNIFESGSKNGKRRF